MTQTHDTAHEHTFGFSLWRWDQVPAMHRAHTHPDIEINWMPETTLEYLIAGKSTVIAAGELGVFWGGVPHQLLRATPQRQGGIWLTLPLSWFLSRNFSNALTTRLMSGEVVTLPFDALRILQWEKDFAASESHHRILLLELEAVLERMALVLLPAHQEPRLTLPEHPSLIERISLFLATHYQQALTMPFIAEAMNVHPNYMMTAFRQACGISIQTYLIHLRLAHAQKLLSTTKLSVLDIAIESGFGSLSQFYQHFSKHLGERPLSYRKKQTLN
jgi:AraC-like DNA-binding protein